jgi:hypothetical protein
MFREGSGSLADVDDEDAGVVYLEDDDLDRTDQEPWDPDEQRDRQGA